MFTEGDKVTYWLDNVQCVGDEESLFSCSHSGKGNYNCHQNQRAKISCRGNVHSTSLQSWCHILWGFYRHSTREDTTMSNLMVVSYTYTYLLTLSMPWVSPKLSTVCLLLQICSSRQYHVFRKGSPQENMKLLPQTYVAP